VEPVGLSTLGGASGTDGTSSTPSGSLQVTLVGAAEVKMAKKVKKRRTATVRLETGRDIVLTMGVRSGLGRWESKSTEGQVLLYCERRPLNLLRHVLRAKNRE
jgi:hypothetical protein